MFKLILFELLHASVAQQWVDAPVPNSDGVATSEHALEHDLVMYVEPNREPTFFFSNEKKY